MRFSMTVLICIIDVFAAAAIAVFNEGNEWLTFFLLVSIFWFAPVLLGLWGFVKFWGIYKLFVKRRLVRFYNAKFHEYKFPSASSYYDEGDYLSAIMDDPGTPLNAKLKAAAFVGEFAGYRNARPFTTGLANLFAFQEAMSNYRATTSYDGGLTDDQLDQMDYFKMPND